MKAPIFNSARATTPAHNVDSGALAWILEHDPVLYQRTQAVRTAADPGPLKLQLPGVCLGGPFRGLRAGDDHGRTTRQHNRHQCSGYRNGHHADWGARTGLVLIDIDDLESPATPDCVKFMLTHAAEPVALAWTSARGRGLKVGVLTTPTPGTPNESRWAWEAARKFMVDFLRSAGLQEGVDYKIDPTFSVPQLAILAHDPSPLGRVPDSQTAVAWTPGPPAPRGLTTGSGAAPSPVARHERPDSSTAVGSWWPFSIHAPAGCRLCPEWSSFRGGPGQCCGGGAQQRNGQGLRVLRRREALRPGLLVGRRSAMGHGNQEVIG